DYGEGVSRRGPVRRRIGAGQFALRGGSFLRDPFFGWPIWRAPRELSGVLGFPVYRDFWTGFPLWNHIYSIRTCAARHHRLAGRMWIRGAGSAYKLPKSG